ncbi:MAG TPA: hypothetical protein VMM13_11660 [Euzebya sp.]|nr:hypothetical protein [Euzebya sp.]
MAYKLPNPERERTERNRELKRLRSKVQPGPERARRAAELAVAFHEERSINDVMALVQLVIDDSEDGVALLMETYQRDLRGTEERMERLAMLANVAHWTDLEALEEASRSEGIAAATTWCAAVDDEMERAERLSLVERRFDADLRQAVQARLLER